MNRIFHARIAWYQYFLLIILAVNAFAALWGKHIILAVLMMLLLIVVIEQVIHTTYTITAEGELVLYYGRFIRKKTIPLKDITAIRKVHSMKFGGFSVTNYVLIEYGKGKFASALPLKEEEFMERLKKAQEASPPQSPSPRGEGEADSFELK